jgi:hypothetical protein
MNTTLKEAYEAELAAAHAETAAGRIEHAFRHLERAHILGQRDTWGHVRSHWLMLRLAVSVRQWREAAGQATRIVAALLFSRIWVPIGNTGRANVSALAPMTIPEDLRILLEAGGAPWQ